MIRVVPCSELSKSDEYDRETSSCHRESDQFSHCGSEASTRKQVTNWECILKIQSEHKRYKWQESRRGRWDNMLLFHLFVKLTLQGKVQHAPAPHPTVHAEHTLTFPYPTSVFLNRFPTVFVRIVKTKAARFAQEQQSTRSTHQKASKR